jgi:hypothetical protein
MAATHLLREDSNRRPSRSMGNPLNCGYANPRVT